MLLPMATALNIQWLLLRQGSSSCGVGLQRTMLRWARSEGSRSSSAKVLDLATISRTSHPSRRGCRNILDSRTRSRTATKTVRRLVRMSTEQTVMARSNFQRTCRVAFTLSCGGGSSMAVSTTIHVRTFQWWHLVTATYHGQLQVLHQLHAQLHGLSCQCPLHSLCLQRFRHRSCPVRSRRRIQWCLHRHRVQSIRPLAHWLVVGCRCALLSATVALRVSMDLAVEWTTDRPAGANAAVISVEVAPTE